MKSDDKQLIFQKSLRYGFRNVQQKNGNNQSMVAWGWVATWSLCLYCIVFNKNMKCWLIENPVAITKEISECDFDSGKF